MVEPFTNEPIGIADLPQLHDDAFVPVDPRYLRASLIALTVAALVIAVGGTLIASQAEEPLTVAAVAGAMLGLVAVRAVFRTMEVRRLAYQVRAHDLSIRSGVITHRTASLPFSRVQHVGIHRGAIERALGLATLQVSSAGPNIAIPGLSDADAERIKLLVTERAGDIKEPKTVASRPEPPPPERPAPGFPSAFPAMAPPPPAPTSPPPPPAPTGPPPHTPVTPPSPAPPPPSPPSARPISGDPPSEPPTITR